VVRGGRRGLESASVGALPPTHLDVRARSAQTALAAPPLARSCPRELQAFTLHAVIRVGPEHIVGAVLCPGFQVVGCRLCSAVDVLI